MTKAQPYETITVLNETTERNFMTLTELKRQCREEVERCYDVAEKYFGREFERPTITFSKRMTSTAGYAYYRKGKIKLSIPLLETNQEAFVGRTPGHEAAHIIAFEVYGDTGHGRGWKSVMRLFGLSTKRTHSMKRKPGTERKRFVYVAACGTRCHVGPTQHKRIMRGITYRVKRTGGAITHHHFSGEAA